MPAITVWQPWASLVAAGCKPYEFRQWPAPKRLVGQRIAIHAGARKVRRTELQQLLLSLNTDGGFGTALAVHSAIALLERWLVSPSALPHSAVLCTATLGRPTPARVLFATDVADSDRIDHQTWAWPLDDVRPVDPIDWRPGAQGFWSWIPARDPLKDAMETVQ